MATRPLRNIIDECVVSGFASLSERICSEWRQAANQMAGVLRTVRVIWQF